MFHNVPHYASTTQSVLAAIMKLSKQKSFLRYIIYANYRSLITITIHSDVKQSKGRKILHEPSEYLWYRFPSFCVSRSSLYRVLHFNITLCVRFFLWLLFRFSKLPVYILPVTLCNRVVVAVPHTGHNLDALQ